MGNVIAGLDCSSLLLKSWFFFQEPGHRSYTNLVSTVILAEIDLLLKSLPPPAMLLCGIIEHTEGTRVKDYWKYCVSVLYVTYGDINSTAGDRWIFKDCHDKHCWVALPSTLATAWGCLYYPNFTMTINGSVIQMLLSCLVVHSASILCTVVPL